MLPPDRRIREAIQSVRGTCCFFFFAFDKHRKWPLAKPLRACLIAVLHAKFLK